MCVCFYCKKFYILCHCDSKFYPKNANAGYEQHKNKCLACYHDKLSKKVVSNQRQNLREVVER